MFTTPRLIIVNEWFLNHAIPCYIGVVHPVSDDKVLIKISVWNLPQGTK